MEYSLSCITSIDGRYSDRTRVLSDYFSEKALIKYRLKIEIEYLICLIRVLNLDIIHDEEKYKNFKFNLRNIYNNMKDDYVIEIKKIESNVKHDVKSIELFLRSKLTELNFDNYNEYIHFGLTSQDINSTSYVLSFYEANNEVFIPHINILLDNLNDIIIKYKHVPMLSRTHGQPASPTLLGKEINVFSYRLSKQLELLKSYKYTTKFGGAVGNFNSHYITYPQIDWIEFSDSFIELFDFKRNKYTTQIDIYDNYSELFDILKRISIILLDLSRDMWLYISQEYFKQKCISTEVGSSTMPHKINPIYFENAEGNLMMAITLFEFLSKKLPVSRLQRDLTDSTVLRNVGTCFAYLLISITSICEGFKRIEPNLEKIKSDLNNNSIVLAEAIQSILRRESVDNSYDIIKSITRKDSEFSIDNVLKEIEGKLEYHLNKNKIIDEIKLLDVNNYTGIYE
jgi:adenylosuccinate lyase